MPWAGILGSPIRWSGSLPQHLLLVRLAIAADAVKAYRAWHDRHIRELLDAVPGFVSASRWEAASRAELSDRTAGFIAIYKIEGDPDAALAELEDAKINGSLTAPPPGVVLESSSVLYRAGRQ